MTDRVAITAILRMGVGPTRTDQDLVAAEAPLTVEIIQPDSDARERLGLLMRTPGDDDDLIRGHLLTEGIIGTSGEVLRILLHPDEDGGTRAEVTLAQGVARGSVPERGSMRPTSACGLCGQLELRAMSAGPRATDAPRLDPAMIARIPASLRNGQTVFAETGGLHAAALVGLDGQVAILREDIGRHNAVDKAIGAAAAAGRLPARDAILAVSGRVAYEIVQKATVAEVAVVVAVGAPSSLAVAAARAAGLTLIGFARDGRFNVYTGPERIQ